MLPRFGEMSAVGLFAAQFTFLVLGVAAVVWMMRRRSELFLLKPDGPSTPVTEAARLLRHRSMAILLVRWGCRRRRSCCDAARITSA
jgi:hypothetical protein